MREVVGILENTCHEMKECWSIRSVRSESSRKERPSRYSDRRKTRQILYIANMTFYDTHNVRDVFKICTVTRNYGVYSFKGNHINVIYRESEGFRPSCSSFSQLILMYSGS